MPPAVPITDIHAGPIRGPDPLVPLRTFVLRGYGGLGAVGATTHCPCCSDPASGKPSRIWRPDRNVVR
jgi:hypothetical protein